MFQDNPLLAQLKQQLHAQTPRVEGIVKATEKGYGFLEVDNQKSYFIPPPQMKKVMHGDRISAVIRTDKDREFVEPETLLEPFLSRFVGRVQGSGDKLSVIADHPLLKEPILCKAARGLSCSFRPGDWAVAQMRRHPLTGDRHFFAELSQFITTADDHFAPWWVTLARHELERDAPQGNIAPLCEDGISREDLTALPFVTIDGASTEDMDDALYACESDNGDLQLIVAIADPGAWIAEGSELDNIARVRQFTNYLPGFNIPMLPREMADHACSLRPGEIRPVLACAMTFASDGNFTGNGRFFLASIQSKARLVYDDVSDWLEQETGWQPENEEVARQIRLLQRISQLRTQWRQKNALVFKDRPDYRFVLGDNGEVLDIVIETRRTANRMVEEAMIAANICAAQQLRAGAGFGIFNVHAGFEASSIEQLISLLKARGIETSAAGLLTLDGFCQLRRQLDAGDFAFIDNRIRRFQAFAGISTSPQPHFGLGLEVYATWTSPLRKYGDLINQRILKAIIKGETPQPPAEDLPVHMLERRRLNRLAERDVSDWLYARFLQDKMRPEFTFQAEITDVSRGGLRVRLLQNGASAFIPGSFLHPVRDELICSPEHGQVQIKGQVVYRLADKLDVRIDEVRMETRSIVARPVV